jgi:hypothetical protein
MGRTTTGPAAAPSGYEPGGNGESRFRKQGRDRYMIGTCGDPNSLLTFLTYRPAVPRSGAPPGRSAPSADDVQLGSDLAECRNFRGLELQGGERLDGARVGVKGTSRNQIGEHTRAVRRHYR